MPTYLALGTLSQDGYENIQQGPETVRQFVKKINAMGGSFDEDDFYAVNGEYDWAAIVEFPSEEAAAMVTNRYARSGRGRIQTELILAQGPDGYEDYAHSLLETE
jgi:uncharacterized protein with GYD domain